MYINMNIGALVEDLHTEFYCRNSAQCDNEKADKRGNDTLWDATQDRFERHDDKIRAIIHVLRYAFGIDVKYNCNSYGYVTHVILSGNIEYEFDIRIPRYITEWINSEKDRIYHKYFEVE